MGWWDDQANLGYWEPMGQPRGTEIAEYPLRGGVRYRVSMYPDKSHELMPGEDHSYCGRVLAPDEEYLMVSGYEDYFWIVIDTRKEKGNTCGDCSRWKSRWHGSAWAPRGRPSTKNVSEEEWESLDAGVQAARKQFEMKARWVAGELGAEIVEAA